MSESARGDAGHRADLVLPPCVLSSVSLDTLDADSQTTLDHQAVSGWYVWETCCSRARLH